MPAPLESLLSILAGFVLTLTLSLGTDTLLQRVWPARFDAAGCTQDGWILALTLAYILVYVVAGCSFTAFLAPGKPRQHALLLGFTVKLWDAFPAWYGLGRLVLLLPGLPGSPSRRRRRWSTARTPGPAAPGPTWVAHARRPQPGGSRHR